MAWDGARRFTFQDGPKPGAVVLHAPQVLRALVRADEIWLVTLAAFIGAAGGIAVEVEGVHPEGVLEVVCYVEYDPEEEGEPLFTPQQLGL